MRGWSDFYARTRFDSSIIFELRFHLLFVLCFVRLCRQQPTDDTKILAQLLSFLLLRNNLLSLSFSFLLKFSCPKNLCLVQCLNHTFNSKFIWNNQRNSLIFEIDLLNDEEKASINYFIFLFKRRESEIWNLQVQSVNIHAEFCMDNQCIWLALTRRADFCMRPLKKCAHTHREWARSSQLRQWLSLLQITLF